MTGKHSAAELTANLRAKRAGDSGASYSSSTIDLDEKAPAGGNPRGADSVISNHHPKVRNDEAYLHDDSVFFNPSPSSPAEIRQASAHMPVDSLTRGGFEHIGKTAARLIAEISAMREGTK